MVEMAKGNLSYSFHYLLERFSGQGLGTLKITALALGF